MSERKISKSALKKLRKQIRDRERNFQNMSLARKRVAIAKDVLDSLKTRKIIASAGTYVGGKPEDLMSLNEIWDENKSDYVTKDEKDGKQFRDVLVENNLPSCTACAVGSIFMCTVLRHDDITVNDCNSGDDESMRSYLKKFFTRTQLDLMESAFEKGGFGYTNRTENAIDFGKLYRTDNERLKAIMENVVRNNGTFNPEDEKERFINGY